MRLVSWTSRAANPSERRDDINSREPIFLVQKVSMWAKIWLFTRFALLLRHDSSKVSHSGCHADSHAVVCHHGRRQRQGR